VSGTTVSFVETVTFTNKHGSLTGTFTGTIDAVTGQFSASGPVSGATGKLSGATGTLAFSGLLDFATGVFTQRLRGEICADLAK
jgi:hypothetical protein